MADLTEYINKEQEDWSEKDVDELINKRLLNKEEWKQVEFKGSVSDVAETVASYTLSGSGLILVGIGNKGEKIGCKTNRQGVMNHIAQHNEPFPDDVDIFEVSLAQNKSKILIVRVIKGNRVCAYKGAFYRRTGEGDTRVPLHESKIYIYDVGEFDYSKKIFRPAKFSENFDKKRYDNFVTLYEEKRKVKVQQEPESFLDGICHVLEECNSDKVFNAAGVLLFSTNPQHFVPHSTIRCIRYEGNDTSMSIGDERECSGNLIELIESAYSFVKKNIRKFGSVIDTRTVYEYEYPEITFREAIINAVSHRDYLLEALDVQVFIFNNRIEIISPGRFPEKSLEDNIPLKPYPRNRLISELLQSCEYGDKVGSGVRKIVKAMEKLKRKKPAFDDKDGRAKVILWGKSAIVDDLSGKYNLTPKQTKALEIVSSDGEIQTGVYSQLLKSSRLTARKELNELVKLRILTKKGKGRTCKYVFYKDIE
jgi:ATP-dependent DNA helicase RecG